MHYPTLLTPLELPGDRHLKNRIVMPPLVIWQADETAEVTDTHLRHYRQTVPGCGLAVVEATTVGPEGRLAATQLGIFHDRHVPGLRLLADTIRAAGALPGIQIHHAGGRTDRGKTWGAVPLAPSPIPGKDDVRELSDDDILRIIEDFSSAARRALDAGFELLEIHGAHGYLGSQFLSPRTNRRTDRWGGSLENRLRFLTETVAAVRAVTGDRALISCRLGVAEAPPREGEVALGPDEGVRAAALLAAEGLDMIHVSHGGSAPAPIEGSGEDNHQEEHREREHREREHRESFSPDPVLQLSRPVRGAVTIPVIGVSGIVTPSDGEAALNNGYCDLIAVGRGMLADPQWALKATEGRPGDIERCVRCKPRCFHFGEPEKCPARKRLGIGTPGS